MHFQKCQKIENYHFFSYIVESFDFIRSKSKRANHLMVESLIPEGVEGLTVSFDGKTIRSTGKMEKYTKPMHIVSAHIAEMGITFGQQTVYEKSNEIPAVRELLELLELNGCIVVQMLSTVKKKLQKR